mmetsp:Transcript_25613/g.63550  ORF Transcript_25613/g.63550 Transcript_25613/m.63550 type:complete len:220 (+) Transcript_25613:85-744(+)
MGIGSLSRTRHTSASLPQPPDRARHCRGDTPRAPQRAQVAIHIVSTWRGIAEHRCAQRRLQPPPRSSTISGREPQTHAFLERPCSGSMRTSTMRPRQQLAAKRGRLSLLALLLASFRGASALALSLLRQDREVLLLLLRLCHISFLRCCRLGALLQIGTRVAQADCRRSGAQDARLLHETSDTDQDNSPEQPNDLDGDILQDIAGTRGRRGRPLKLSQR